MNRLPITASVLLLAWIVLPLPAQTGPMKQIRLSGPQEGFYEKAVYVVDSTFTVEKGKTVTFAAGSTIRFRKYAQAVIEGQLEAVGSSSEPIFFTSEHDGPRGGSPGVEPRAFDWNGIVVASPFSRVDLNYAAISHSSFGLKVVSQLARVQLRNMVFHSNGTGDFSIDGVAVKVTERMPFDYPPIVKTEEESSRDAARDPPWKRPVRYSSGALAVLGAATTAIAVPMMLKLDGEAQTTYSAEARRIGSSRDRWARVTEVSIAATVIGLTGVVFTFFF